MGVAKLAFATLNFHKITLQVRKERGKATTMAVSRFPCRILYSVAALLRLFSCVESFMPVTVNQGGRNSLKLSNANVDDPVALATKWVGGGVDQIQNVYYSISSSPSFPNELAAENLEQGYQSLSTVASQTFGQLPVQSQVAAAVLPVVAFVAPYVPLKTPVRSEEEMYPESKAATYELSKVKMPFEFGDAAFVRPLLRQTQLEFRNLQVAYNANKDGYDAKVFHRKVDGKGAAIVLAKANGQWFGGYNPRGWASLGGSRPSIASFLFYKKFLGGWEKCRALGNGGMSCGNDLFDRGIYLGAEGLVIPLDGDRRVASRLGTYFESRPKGRFTVLPKAGDDLRLQELKILVGVYAKGEDIPNSGGVLDLGLY